MAESCKKQKKGTISEEDISCILQRYSATTVLALLQEVAQFPEAKIDWNELVKKTSTGISNAREYQMLWRYLAYRESLIDKLEEGPEPLDDESDLEYELEADPPVNIEASTEAAACVKVLIASGLPRDSNIPNASTIEAPLTINIPSGRSSNAPSESKQATCSMQGMNITVPVSVQKQPQSAVTSTTGPDANLSTSANIPPRKRRKKWSTEEDMELIAAVQKCGEGNWANILRGDFKGDRTASQLSQRWSTLRKKKGDINVGGANSSGPQLTEAQLAARHAMSVALGTPAKNLTAVSGGTSSNPTSCMTVQPTAGAEALSGSGSVQAQHQPQQGPTQVKPYPTGSLGAGEKNGASSKQVSTKSNIGSDSVRAAAVAAGARIATPSDAATLLKAAQAKNAVRIMPGGGPSMKSSMSGGVSTHMDAQHSLQQISTGFAGSSLSTYPAATSSTSRPGSAITAPPRIQRAPPSGATLSVISSEQAGVASCKLERGPPSKQEGKTSKGIEVFARRGVPKVVKEDETCKTQKSIGEVKIETMVPKQAAGSLAQVGDEIGTTAPKTEATGTGLVAEDHQNASGRKKTDMLVKGGENETVDKETCQNQSTNEKKTVPPNTKVDGCGEKVSETGSGV